MEVKLPEEISNQLDKKLIAELGITEDTFRWNKYAEINLREMTITQVKKFRSAILPHKMLRGGGVMIKDIEVWLATVEKGRYPTPRKVEHFCDIIIEMIAKVPGHRIFIKEDVEGIAWVCYYVEEIEYTPEKRNSRDEKISEFVHMDLFYSRYGVRKNTRVYFYEEDVLHFKPEEALARKGIYCETSEMRGQYLKELKRYGDIYPHIGKQFLVRGIAVDSADGNKKSRDSSWWYHRTNRIEMDKNGEPSRVVIDVFHEDDDEDRRSNEAHLSLYFWRNNTRVFHKTAEKKAKEDEEKRAELPIEDAEERPIIEIPVHPILVCFDLKRHLRLCIHVNCLTEYKYDSKLGEKLILPQQTTDLVDMLLQHKGIFLDIIKGKGGGVIVLCSGAPGTGKTLTAEVYSEVVAKPLYSIQASQLGTKPEELEEELLKVFARSQRWNAILLLDEADVYVHRRGDSLQQNAIVGVFLRVLEYYNGVMFLTTNRGQDVDDAIASRCIARIDYKVPVMRDQMRIWRVLSDVMGVVIIDSTIKKIVRKHKDLSGRDIKNLLKLGKLVCDTKKCKFTISIVNFVRKFKPTETL